MPAQAPAIREESSFSNRLMRYEAERSGILVEI